MTAPIRSPDRRFPPPPRRLQIERVHIPRPKEGDSHSKFGFIHFRDRGAASRAVEDDHKPEMDGVTLNVRAAGGRGGQGGRGGAGWWGWKNGRARRSEKKESGGPAGCYLDWMGPGV